MENTTEIKMDFSLSTPEERTERTKQIINSIPSERLTPKYLEKLADYIIFAADKEERKEKKILTDNHMLTVNARETSFEGLVGKLENGEDGIYNLITNDKNIIFKPKVEITAEDRAEIPELQQLYEAILEVEEQLKTARGKRAYQLKKQIIQMRQDQYVIKAAFKKPIYCSNIIRGMANLDLSEKITIDADGSIHSTGLINLFNEKHISALLCNYSRIKEDTHDKLLSDARWLMEDLDTLVERALSDFPLYLDLLIYKIDGKSNAEIQSLLNQKYNIKHSIEYISSLWRNKIPKLIAETASKEYLEWHYTNKEEGTYKKCSRCGQIKLAHPFYFSKNKTSKDHFYSICKECRNKKG